jgi:3-methyl-2-oxobutanoate hydroxymethyltransferase
MSVHPVEPSAAAPRPALNLPRLRDMAARGEKLAMVTCYDATFAQLLDAAEVDIQLVGDSLGNVVQGQSSTLPVTLEHMAYHTACVARAKRQAWLVTDMPFGSYEASPQQAFESAAALMRAGAQMVKIEGGGDIAHTVRFLVDRGIPVCGHLGLTPQRVHALGASASRGVTRPPRPSSRPMPRPWPRPVPPCWCWSWCPRPWRARSPRPIPR